MFRKILPLRLAALMMSCCFLNPASAVEDAYQTANVSHSTQAGTDIGPELTIRAINLIGIPYKYGGDSPENGMDCSGLVRYVFKHVSGTELPRTSHEISQFGDQIHSQELQPGDLVFYNTLRRAYSHVGIYLGEGKFVHAPSSGGYVRIESMDIRYWRKRFNGARRINITEQRIPLRNTLSRTGTEPVGWQE